MNGRPSGLETGSHTEAGPREQNEDGVLCEELAGGALLAAVADGMGGLEAGALASRTALSALRSAVEEGRPLAEAIREANAAVRARSGEARTGTTLVAALIAGDQVRVAHVGDSRAYHRGPIGLSQLTRDHTVGAEADASGEWAGREVAGTRWGEGLTRSLGADDHVEVDEMGPFTLGPSAYLVLTSDGVHGALDLETIEEVLNTTPGAKAGAARLVRLALDRGGRDNASAVVVRRAAAPAGPRPRGHEMHPSDMIAHREEPRSRRAWWLPGILACMFLVLGGLAFALFLS